jgi:hypothetical protein
MLRPPGLAIYFFLFLRFFFILQKIFTRLTYFLILICFSNTIKKNYLHFNNFLKHNNTSNKFLMKNRLKSVFLLLKFLNRFLL